MAPQFGFGFGGGYTSVKAAVPAPPTGADHTVATNGQWDAVMALSAAELSGKTVELVGNNFSPLTIANKNLAPTGGRLTIRSRDADAQVERLTFSGTNSAITLQVNFQMRGWPYNYFSMVNLATGTHSDIVFDGCSFRHGYGPSQQAFDILAQYPEYERVANVRTATTTPATYALAWQNPAMTVGWLEFFNRGTSDVYVSVGGSGVSVGTAGAVQSGTGTVKVNRRIPAGTKNRITGLDPTADTHMAIMTASGSSEVNARAEIGMYYYLASCFQNTGGALGKLVIRRSKFRDVANAIKGLTGSAGAASEFYVDSNDLDRVYMDCIYSTGRAQVTRNLLCAAFARSGIAEDALGDAFDPHGDGLQMAGAFGTNTTISDVLVAGNRMRIRQRRVGCSGQGEFISDNDANPSYMNYRSVSNTWLGGATNGQASGEPGFPLGDSLWYGSTMLDMANVAGGGAGIRFNTDGNYTVCATRSIVQGVITEDQPFQLADVLNVTQQPDPAALFPNFNLAVGATTRAEIETMLTGVGPAASVGAVASSNAIDWDTDNLDNVVKWELVPSGVSWNSLPQQALGTVITLPLRKVLNPRATQAVVPGAGVEWRTVGTDKVTQVQAWTSAPGSVATGHYLQIRKTSSSESGGTTTADITINGFTESTVIPSVVATPAVYVTSAGGYLLDPVAPGSAITQVAMRGKFYFPSVTGFKLLSQVSTGCDLEVTGGKVRIRVEDGVGTPVVANSFFGGGAVLLVQDRWYSLVLSVDQAAGTCDLSIDGTVYSQPFTPTPGSAFFQTIRAFSLFGTGSGLSLAPAGTRGADMQLEFNGAVRKAFSNVAATVNADPWKQGPNFT